LLKERVLESGSAWSLLSYRKTGDSGEVQSDGKMNTERETDVDFALDLSVQDTCAVSVFLTSAHRWERIAYSLLTPHSTVVLEKLASSHPVKKFPAFYGTPKVHYRIHRRPRYEAFCVNIS